MSAKEALTNAESEIMEQIRGLQEDLRVFKLRGRHKGQKRELNDLRIALEACERRLRNLGWIKIEL